MTTASTSKKPSAPRPRARTRGKISTTISSRRATAEVQRELSSEAEATLDAIRAGQIDALIIRDDESEKLYALRTFAEIEQSQAALRKAGTERRRTHAQLRAFVEERERLFQDMHDGCIHSIYAVGLNLEACLLFVEANPKKARQMIADATASDAPELP